MAYRLIPLFGAPFEDNEHPFLDIHPHQNRQYLRLGRLIVPSDISSTSKSGVCPSQITKAGLLPLSTVNDI